MRSVRGTTVNRRYKTANRKKNTNIPTSFVVRSIRQTVTCAILFLICLPLSSSNNPLRPYIARTLVATSDVRAVQLHFTQLCMELDKRYPTLSANPVWSGFVSILEREKEPVPTGEPVSESVSSTQENLELVAKAEPIEFVFPETAEFVMPVSGEVTSPYGKREHPVSGDDTIHYGVDISGNKGDPVKSSAPGKVVEVKVHDIYGNCILIQHTPTLKTFYAHLDKIDVAEGEVVNADTKIGEVGMTGVTTGPHLHFGMRENDQPVDPKKYIKLQ